MFEQVTSEGDDRGQVGIGTLIIFIALVLVAAVAAGVLINTAGELQSRASDTGDDAQAQVSNQIDVVSATGSVSGSSVNEVVLVVKKSPGSDPIDLSEATIEYTSSSSSATLSFHSSTVNGSLFTTTKIGNSGPTEILDDTSERIEIKIDVSSIETDGLAEGANAELQIVDQSGASTVYGVNIPDVLTGEYAKV
jgi:flagellin FlaB